MVCVLLLGMMQSLAVAAADPLAPQTAVSRREPRIGRTDPQKTLALAVALKADDRALDAHLERIYDPASPEYRRFLTPDQFTARFVSRSDRTEVAQYLRGRGLNVTDRGRGVLLDVSGRVEQVERAFNLTFSDHRDAGGRVFHAADRTPALPASIAARVEGVTGTNGAAKIATRYVRPGPQQRAPQQSGGRRAQAANGCPAAAYVANTFSAYLPNQISTAYNFDFFRNNNLRGEGQSVALFELSTYDPANVAAYQSCFGTTVDIVNKPVDGGAAYDVDIAVEVELDMEVIIGLAPKLDNLYVYSSPADNASIETSILRQYQAIANDNLAPVVSTSYGFCELDVNSYFRNTENLIFRQMAAQGQSFYNAIGDTGSSTCLPGSGFPGVVADDIGSQPWVTGVGGTTLFLDPTTNARTAETVWNDFALIPQFDHGATGGGVSRFWPRPAWQLGPGVQNSFSTGKRQSPDVAANADPLAGYVVYTNYPGVCLAFADPSDPMPDPDNCFQPIGGTSAGAPLWAAGTALINQYLAANNKPRLGFANPTLYNVFRTSTTAFYDVTGGDNCYDDACLRNDGIPGDGTGLYPATAGYDMTTGIGVANFGFLAQRIAETGVAITALSPGSGPVSGGTPVEITGTGFTMGMTLTLGGQPLAYQYISPTKIRVVTPAHATGAVELQVISPVYVSITNAFLYVLPTAAMLATAPPPTPAIPVGANTPTPTPPRPAPQPMQRATAPPPTRAMTGISSSDVGTAAPGVATPLPAPVRR